MSIEWSRVVPSTSRIINVSSNCGISVQLPCIHHQPRWNRGGRWIEINQQRRHICRTTNAGANLRYETQRFVPIFQGVAVLLTCPICRAECTIDDLSVDSVTCPTCGQQLSTRTGSPASPVAIGETPAEKDETREWHEAVVSTAPDIDLLPVRLGRYFIESLIAQGGFAKVYLATDEALGRRVALKIPRLEKFKTPAKLREFLAEARIAAKLRHPGIVTIFDVGQFANGTNYIAMEYVAGQSLADLMQAGRIPVPRAVDLLVKVAEAVHYAHGQGLVHRDLKPGNVLIDERGEPRVVDFGLAVHETAQEQLQGEVAGTPAYMSPEQFRGEVHRLDGRTDIWSLGVVIYQLLTGRRPFNGNVNQLYDEVSNKAPKPPRQIDDQIPRELEAICFKCLSKSMDDRYTTAKDLAEDLQGWQSSRSTDRESIPPGPPGLELKTATHGRRFRWMAVVGATLAISCLIGLLAASFSQRGQSNGSTLPPNPNPPTQVPITPPGGFVESSATAGVWFPLLRYKPKPLVFAETSTERWGYDPKNEDVFVDAADIMLAELGETQAEEYKLQVTITKNSWSGWAGLFWGYSPIDPSNASAGFRCQTIYGSYYHEGSTPVLNLRRESVEFSVKPPHMSRPLMGTTIRIQNVNVPTGDGTTMPIGQTEKILEVRIRSGRVVSVHWGGVEIDGLRDTPQTPETVVALPHGRFGIVNSIGTSRYRDARFQLVSEESKTE